MREILFRGKTTDRGEWVQGCYTETLRYNNFHWIWNGKNHFTVNPETVGQYTGLTDKNGTKIFEGDILQDMDGGIQIAVFERGAFYGRYVVNGCLDDEFYDNKVIGNIHDNKLEDFQNGC